jgi:hypothetical protein
MITIEGKALGNRRRLFSDWSIPMPPDLGGGGGGDLTLRDLIARIVRAEVAAFRDRREERRLVRALSAGEIAEGVAKGKVDMGGRDVDQEVDEDQAVAAALQAFEDGIYLVAVDGRDVRDLEQAVYLTPDSRVTFIRLALLAGG